MPPDENTPAQISEENKTENLVGQATSIPENITEILPIEQETSPSVPLPPQREGLSDTKIESEIPISDPLPFGEGEGGVPKVETEVSTNGNITIEKTPNTVTITEIMPVPNSEKTLIAELLAKANVKRLEKKRKRLDKVMEMFLKTNAISNDQVERFLHISDATATRYLNTLEKENKIRQTGNNGRSTVYVKV